MKNKFIILQGEKRWVLERILASVFFAVVVYFSFLFFYKIPIAFTEQYIKNLSDYFYVIILCVSFGVYYSYEQHHHFNLKDNKHRIYYTIGPFGLGKWKKIANLSYMAVNHISTKKLFEVNIWDESNNRFKISYHTNKDEAKETAKNVSKKLHLTFYCKDSS